MKNRQSQNNNNKNNNNSNNDHDDDDDNNNNNNNNNNDLQVSYICNVYVLLYYEIPWFYQDFKSQILCFLDLHSVHAARILDLSTESC